DTPSARASRERAHRPLRQPEYDRPMSLLRRRIAECPAGFHEEGSRKSASVENFGSTEPSPCISERSTQEIGSRKPSFDLRLPAGVVRQRPKYLSEADQ